VYEFAEQVFSAGPQGNEKFGGVWICVRRFIIYYNQSRQGTENALFLLHVKALGALHPMMLNKLHVGLVWGLTSRGASGHGLIRLCLNPPQIVWVEFLLNESGI
jgi:hypothetical protein